MDSRDPDLMAVRAARFHSLLEELIEASVGLQPRWLKRRYEGNLVQDATKFAMLGARGNPIVDDRESDRTSINFDAGPYKRGGSHNGETEKKNKTEHALEAEIAVMAKNKPGEPADFPLLVIDTTSIDPA